MNQVKTNVISILRKITFIANTHCKKVRKNACTLFYFKIKKKHNTFTSILHALLMSKKKDKCFII